MGVAVFATVGTGLGVRVGGGAVGFTVGVAVGSVHPAGVGVGVFVGQAGSPENGPPHGNEVGPTAGVAVRSGPPGVGVAVGGQ